MFVINVVYIILKLHLKIKWVGVIETSSSKKLEKFKYELNSKGKKI